MPALQPHPAALSRGRRGLRVALLGALVAGPVAGPARAELGPDALVGRVGEREVRLAEVDARLGGSISRLLARRREALGHALEARIDAALLAHAHGSEAAAEAALDALAEPDAATLDRALAQHADALPQHTGQARSVLRHLLAETGRPRARSRRLAELRGRLAIERARLPESGPWPEVLARVEGVEVRAEEVRRAARLPLYRSRARAVAEARRGFAELADEILAAAAAGAEPEVAPPSDRDVARYIAERPGADLTPERVRPYLAFRRRAEARERWLAGLRAATPPRLLLEEPMPPRFALEDLGLAGSPLILFDNFRCRPCAEQWRLLGADPPAAVTWLPFFATPRLALHADALAGVCAAEQGALGALRTGLLAGREGPDAADPLLGLRVAAAIVPTREAWERCIASEAAQRRASQGLRVGRRIGFARVPSFLVKGLPVEGFQGIERLRELLAGGGRVPNPRAPEGG